MKTNTNVLKLGREPLGKVCLIKMFLRTFDIDWRNADMFASANISVISQLAELLVLYG